MKTIKESILSSSGAGKRALIDNWLKENFDGICIYTLSTDYGLELQVNTTLFFALKDGKCYFNRAPFKEGHIEDDVNASLVPEGLYFKDCCNGINIQVYPKQKLPKCFYGTLAYTHNTFFQANAFTLDAKCDDTDFREFMEDFCKRIDLKSNAIPEKTTIEILHNGSYKVLNDLDFKNTSIKINDKHYNGNTLNLSLIKGLKCNRLMLTSFFSGEYFKLEYNGKEFFVADRHLPDPFINCDFSMALYGFRNNNDISYLFTGAKYSESDIRNFYYVKKYNTFEISQKKSIYSTGKKFK